MYFQNYDYAVRSGAKKMYQALDHIQEILSLWKVITGLCCLFCPVSSVSHFGHPFAYACTILYFFTSIYH